jgi:hypothetical protein
MMMHAPVRLDIENTNRGWTIHRNRNRNTSTLAA